MSKAEQAWACVAGATLFMVWALLPFAVFTHALAFVGGILALYLVAVAVYRR